MMIVRLSGHPLVRNSLNGLDLLSDNARDIIPEAAPNLNPGQDALPMVGGLDPAPQAAHSSVASSDTGPASVGACKPGAPTPIRLLGPGRSLLSQPSQVGLR